MTAPEPFAFERHLLAADRNAAHLQLDRRRRHRPVAAVDQSGGHRHPLLIRERRPRERHAGHADVRLVDRRSSPPPASAPRPAEAARLPRPPAGPLEIADQHRLTTRQRRVGQDAARHLQRRPVPRRACTRASPSTAQRRACSRSGDDRTRMSAPEENSTSEARSDAFSPRSASSAALRACAHRSP